MQDEKILLELARLILPSGFIENFKITGITSNDIDVEISLDEFDNLPSERQGHKIESKGFLDAVTVRDRFLNREYGFSREGVVIDKPCLSRPARRELHPRFVRPIAASLVD